MRFSTLLAALLFAAVLSPALVKAQSPQPFTATAVQSVNGQNVQSGQIFVSGTKTRFEYVDQGRKIVKIVLPQQHIMRILFPQDKVYMEISAPGDVPMMAGEAKTPCPPVDGLTCTKVGDAKYGNLDVQKWTQTYGDKKSTLWWEPKRNLIVRQEFPDGRVMQMSMSGTVDYEGRKAESWNIVLADTKGQRVSANRLIDTDLGIILKDSMPGNGMTRELHDVKVVPEQASWFAVPDGYQRIEPNAPTGQVPGQAPGHVPGH